MIFMLRILPPTMICVRSTLIGRGRLGVGISTTAVLRRGLRGNRPWMLPCRATGRIDIAGLDRVYGVG